MIKFVIGPGSLSQCTATAEEVSAKARAVEAGQCITNGVNAIALDLMVIRESNLPETTKVVCALLAQAFELGRNSMFDDIYYRRR